MKVELKIDGVEYKCTPKGNQPPVEKPKPPVEPPPPEKPIVDLDITKSSRRNVYLTGMSPVSRTIHCPMSAKFAVRVSYQPHSGAKVRMRLKDMDGQIVMERQSLFVLSHTLNVGDELHPGEFYELEIENWAPNVAQSYADEQISVLRK